MSVKYKRVLLKLSGEALSGDKGFGLDMDTIRTHSVKASKYAHDLGAEIAIVVGGGNFWRGRSSGDMERTRADQIGMLATVMNALAVADALEHLGLEVRVQTALSACSRSRSPISATGPPGIWKKGRVVILACGTGNPFFSTDTASALRAAEINAEIVFKATMVDGVYDKDPQPLCTTRSATTPSPFQQCAGGPAGGDGFHRCDHVPR